jgi:hypothetical protein
MANLLFLEDFRQMTTLFYAPPRGRPNASQSKTGRSEAARSWLAISKTGQHIERMVALQQLEKLRICMTMHIPKLLKAICDLAQTMNDQIAPVKNKS